MTSQGKTAVVWTCAHDRPEVSHDRFKWLGNLIEDIKPDYCIDLGDGAEMASLNSFDTRYPQAVVSQSYEADIESYNRSQDIIWGRYRKSKKKRPYRIKYKGNHEYRIDRALKHDPRLEGAKYGISAKHLQDDHWFDDYHDYENGGPSIATYDGVAYAHFFSSGNMGAAMSGMHHAKGIMDLRKTSATCGHSHKRSLFFADGVGSHGTGLIGLVAGCFKGAKESWAGQQADWWKGVVIKRNISNGYYDPQFISMAALEREYGQT
jgi:hypothetical protein